jgi:hypothetical protein
MLIDGLGNIVASFIEDNAKYIAPHPGNAVSYSSYCLPPRLFSLDDQNDAVDLGGDSQSVWGYCKRR